MSALQLMKRAHWDDEQEVWVLQRLSDAAKQRGGAPKRPVSAAGARRPVSAYAKVGVLGSPGACARGGPDSQNCMTVSSYAQGSGTVHPRRLCGRSKCDVQSCIAVSTYAKGSGTANARCLRGGSVFELWEVQPCQFFCRGQ